MTLSVDKLLDRAIQERVATALETQPAEVGSDGFTVTYVFVAENFDTEWTEDIQSPAGYRGEVVAVNIYDVTEQFAGSTSIGYIVVGEQGGDEDGYAICPFFLATNVNEAEAVPPRKGVIGLIPANDDILVTGKAGVGTPAGIATVAVTIRYFI